VPDRFALLPVFENTGTYFTFFFKIQKNAFFTFLERHVKNNVENVIKVSDGSLSYMDAVKQQLHIHRLQHYIKLLIKIWP